MPVPLWFWPYLAIAILGVLAVVWVIIRRTSLDTDDEDDEGEAGRLACPECGAENDGWFRYCGECLEELPRSRVG